ncbi:Alpha/Beta hydrolase protein [Rhizoctonia solani]|nr:Alpha/Beta hydrolase protein [Rhizoctonia solani]
MRSLAPVLCLLCGAASGYTVRPFKINLSSESVRMKALVKQTRLPENSVLGSLGGGIRLSWLRDRQKDWIESFDWEKEQLEMNQFNHSTVDIGNMTVHFIHQRSSDPNAIPLLLTHGWPGSFYEFHELCLFLVRFHVVVPSLPGFGFSSPAPSGWNLNNTADLFDTLLTEVLGYKTYAAVGGDWVMNIIHECYSNSAPNTKYFCGSLYTGMIPQLGPLLGDLNNHTSFANQMATLGEAEKQRIQSNAIFPTDGWGYFLEQSTRPATIGLALLDNPIGQLSWIGDGYTSGDPLMGMRPSTLDNNTILTSVSLYYLTRTFETSVNTYYQNPKEFAPIMRRAANSIPMGFASYRYEAQYYPQFYVAKVGNLVYYSDHERGGHFSALDNPPAYLEDVRSMMGRWYTP